MSSVAERLQTVREAEQRVAEITPLYRGSPPVVRELVAYLQGARAAVAEMSKLAVSVEEAAQMLGVSKDAVYDAIRRGEMPSLKVGRRVVVSYAQLKAMVEGGTDE